jgi:dienelactone hydrolase
MKTKTTTTRRNLIRGAALSALMTIAGTGTGYAAKQTPDFSGTIAGPNGLQLNARLYRPADPGSYPAVIVMHGSGGMWSNDVVSNGILTHLDAWAAWLKSHGYVALFVDSYVARGITSNFSNRRPAEDTTKDDTKCSPATVRPHDAYAARAWLVANATAQKVNTSRIGLLAFSQGAEAALAAVVDETVIANKVSDSDAVAAGLTTAQSKWVQRELQKDGTEKWVARTAPSFHTANQDHFNVVVAYYPGCGFYNYWGKISSPKANMYMPHCPTLVMHGDADSLWGSTVQNFVEKSRLHAVSQSFASDPLTVDLQSWVNENYSADGLTMIGNGVNPMTHVLLPGAHHSFDMAPSNTGYTADDTTAQTNARAIAQTWLETYLKQ